MATTNFQAGTRIEDTWLNAVDALVYDVFNGKNSAGTSGTILRSDGTNIVNSTATYPGTAGTSGTILRSDGTNIVNTTATYPTTTTISQILYSSAANTVAGLATANSSVLVTNGSGVPSLSTTLPDGLTLNAQDSTFRIVGSADATKKLAIEVDGFTTATTRTVTFPDANLTIPAVTAKGDIVAATGSAVLARVAVSATDGDVLIADSTASAGVSYRTKITLGTEQATTSGTSIDFTSIPSWAKRITISGEGISSDGTSIFQIQTGDAGGVETTGYVSRSSTVSGSSSGTATSGFVLSPIANVAANTYEFVVILTMKDSSDFTWSATWNYARSDGVVAYGVGNKATSAALDRVRLTTANGTDTFDAGSINIAYE